VLRSCRLTTGSPGVLRTCGSGRCAGHKKPAVGSAVGPLWRWLRSALMPVAKNAFLATGVFSGDGSGCGQKHCEAQATPSHQPVKVTQAALLRPRRRKSTFAIPKATCACLICDGMFSPWKVPGRQCLGLRWDRQGWQGSKRLQLDSDEESTLEAALPGYQSLQATPQVSSPGWQFRSANVRRGQQLMLFQGLDHVRGMSAAGGHQLLNEVALR